jgi:peptide alpha-N-acetyltransferase
LAMDDKDEMVGVVVSKLEPHRSGPLRGYIAMLAVREEYRGRGIATKLVRMAIDAMIERNADEVCLWFHGGLSQCCLLTRVARNRSSSRLR